MIDQIFNTEEKKERALIILRDGQLTPFWHLMVELLTGQIDILKEQILEGGEDTTKKDMDHLRDKLRIYQDFIKTPQFHIDRFTTHKSEEPSLDPYDTLPDRK